MKVFFFIYILVGPACHRLKKIMTQMCHDKKYDSGCESLYSLHPKCRNHSWLLTNMLVLGLSPCQCVTKEKKSSLGPVWLICSVREVAYRVKQPELFLFLLLATISASFLCGG